MTAGDLGPGPTIEETARALGSARWVEHRLYEVLGSIVPSVVDRPTKLLLAELAPHHAWRAEQLGDRLPRAGHVRAELVTVAPDDTTAELLEGLADRDAADVLAVVHDEIIPGLLQAYESQLERSSPVADAAVIRTLRMVIDDLRRDRAAAEQLLSR